MNLQSELEPVLSKLWETAVRKWAEENQPDIAMDEKENQRLAKQFTDDQEEFSSGPLTELMNKFRSYYTLDGADLEPVPEWFAAAGDAWESPTGSSVYAAIARAAGDVEEVSKMIDTSAWFSPSSATTVNDKSKWNSNAAMEFKKNFLDKFKVAAGVQAVCACQLSIAASALAAKQQRAKECVVWIAKNITSYLGGDADPGPLPGTKEKDSHEKAPAYAIMLDTVAVIVALAAPEIDLVGLGLAAGGASFGIWGEVGKEEGFEGETILITAPGSSVRGLVLDGLNTLERLDTNIAEFDEKLNEALEKSLGSDGPFGNPAARLEDPGLKSSAFRGLDIKDGGYGEVDQVVVNVVRLYYAGYNIMPAAAGQYGSAEGICDNSHISGVEAQFPRTVGKFNEAAEALSGNLSRVKEALTSSGGALVKAATEYEAADAEQAAQIKQLENEIPSSDNFRAVDNYTPPEWLLR